MFRKLSIVVRLRNTENTTSSGFLYFMIYETDANVSVSVMNFFLLSDTSEKNDNPIN